MHLRKMAGSHRAVTRIIGCVLLLGASSLSVGAHADEIECLRSEGAIATIEDPPPQPAIGVGFVASNAREWKSLWNELERTRDQSPPVPLPPATQAVAVTEDRGSTCDSYIDAQLVKSDTGVLNVTFRLANVLGIKPKGGGGFSICDGEIDYRFLVVFLRVNTRQTVHFQRLPRSDMTPSEKPVLGCPKLPL